jgi:hypothetical protein
VAYTLPPGGRRLAGAAEPDDQADLVAVVGRDHLAAGVQREAATVVDELVPHAQPALLRLAEVVGVAHARDAPLEVDRDDAVVRVALDGQVGRVDDGQLGLEGVRVVDVEVQLLLHAGDVGVGLLDVEARGGAELGVVADEAVDHDHVLTGDVLVLELGDPLALLAGDALLRARLGVVQHEEGRRLGPGKNLGLHVEVAVARLTGVRHLGRELLQLLGRRVHSHGFRIRQRGHLLRHRSRISSFEARLGRVGYRAGGRRGALG